MTVKLNIGLSRKVGEANYGSRGASIHLEVELDNGVLNDPATMRGRVRELYALARQSVDDELQRPADTALTEPRTVQTIAKDLVIPPRTATLRMVMSPMAVELTATAQMAIPQMVRPMAMPMATRIALK